MTSQQFGKRKRLRKRKDFLATYREGARFAGRYFHIYRRKRPEEGGRLGISVSRKVGKAVVRNRMKRLIREYFRSHNEMFSGWDVVVVVMPQAAGILNRFRERFEDDIKKVFRSI